MMANPSRRKSVIPLSAPPLENGNASLSSQPASAGLSCQPDALSVRRKYRLSAPAAVATIVFVALLVSACSSLNATQSAALSTPVVQPKILATVFISPTPNEQERAATRAAVDSQPPTPLPSRTAPPTAYIGVFVGDAAGADGEGVVNASLFEGTLAVNLPTLGAPGCAYPVDPVYGINWTTNTSAVSDLGCAGEPSSHYIGTQQIFEHGVMYWIPSGEIWSLAPSGGIDGRFWYVEQAPPLQEWTVPVPEGLRMPQQGFGAVWKAVDGVRQTLGFARVDEQSASLDVQRFDGGALIRDETAAQTFVLVGRDTGIAYGPY